MTYDQLIDHFKTQVEAARRLGIKQPSVAEWKKNGIPLLRQLDIQRRTRGKLKADVHELDAA